MMRPPPPNHGGTAPHSFNSTAAAAAAAAAAKRFTAPNAATAAAPAATGAAAAPSAPLRPYQQRQLEQQQQLLQQQQQKQQQQQQQSRSGQHTARSASPSAHHHSTKSTPAAPFVSRGPPPTPPPPHAHRPPASNGSTSGGHSARSPPPHAAGAAAGAAAAAPAGAVPSPVQATPPKRAHGSFGSPGTPPPRTVFDAPATTRPKTAADCKAPGCYARSNVSGYCIKHFYISSSAGRKGSRSRSGSGSGASGKTAPAVCLSPTSSAQAAAARKAEEERRQLCEELVSTEKSYGRGLKSVVRGMILRLSKYQELSPESRPLMERDEMARVFLNLSDIYDLQQKLYAELKALRFERQLLGPELGKVLLTYTPFFKIYAGYVNGYEASQDLLRRLREERPALDSFFRHCELVEGGRVSDFMIQPVQRVPRYALLLRAIEKVTAADDGSLAGIRTALAGVEAVALDINESFRRQEARARVLDIAAHIEGISAEELVTPHRYFVRDGALEKNARGFCKLKYSLPLLDSDVAEVSPAQYEHAFEIRGPLKAFIVRASSAAEKTEWLAAISATKAALTKNSATLRIAKSPPAALVTSPPPATSSAPVTPGSVSAGGRGSLGSVGMGSPSSVGMSSPPPPYTPTYSRDSPLPGQPPLPPGRPPASVTSPPGRPPTSVTSPPLPPPRTHNRLSS